MSDIKLFRIQGDAVEQLQGTSGAIEASRQELIERHFEALLGVRLLAHEYQIGKTHGGRIDMLARVSLHLGACPRPPAVQETAGHRLQPDD